MIYQAWAKGIPSDCRISDREARDKIDYVLRELRKVPERYGLSGADLDVCNVPALSTVRHFLANFEGASQERITPAIRALAQRLESLLITLPSRKNDLWQCDWQILTRRKVNEILKARPRAGKVPLQIKAIVDADGERVMKLYVMRVTDVGSRRLLAEWTTQERPDQLEIARFLLAAMAQWGVPNIIRMDLAGEQISHGLYTILRRRLGIIVQFKINFSAKLNYLIERVHALHSALLFRVEADAELFVESKQFRGMVALGAAIVVRAGTSLGEYNDRKQRRIKDSPAGMWAKIASWERAQISGARLRNEFYFQWKVQHRGKSGDLLRWEGWTFRVENLRFHRSIYVRRYPWPDADHIELRSLTGALLAHISV
ncbi:MAG: hypothetical protein M3Z36_06640 [Acidobacteriota bacterium]|nr:hypothetical protein [Acidobacteriota bacterium]